MAARNPLLTTPPYAVDQAIRRLGASLRTARVRRNLSIEAVARKIGANRRVVADAERGKPSTGIAVYVALLWTVGLVDQLAAVADPARDDEGAALARSREHGRAHRGRTQGTNARKALSDDF